MELLKNLYRIGSPSRQEDALRKELISYCYSLGCVVEGDNTNNLYITKGESETYPCVVAHMDEVCPERPKGYEVLEANGRLFGFDTINCEQCGIGGDDKNGIWIALKCLEKYDILKCAFFVGEEVGCIGSSRAIMEWFDNCRFVVQCDRRGNSDLVTSIWNDLCSDEFIKDMNPEAYGYKPTEGLLTDVATLKDNGLQVSAVNMSCGYYSPHTKHEYTIIDDLYKCLRFVEHIIEDCVKVYNHTPKSTSKSTRFDDYGWTSSYGSTYNDQLWELEELLWSEPTDDFKKFYASYKDDFKLLTHEDFKNVFDIAMSDMDESASSMRNELQGLLIDDPNLEIDDIIDDLAYEYHLPESYVRMAYEDIMS